MADETSVPPSNGRNIEVTRMSVGSAEVKDMHVDLLEAVNSSINAQTDSLERLSEREREELEANTTGIVGAINSLKSINEELIAVMRSQVGGGEEGGGAGGIAAAELKSHQKSLGIINRVAAGNASLSSVTEELTELLVAESRVMRTSVIEGLIEAGRSLVSFRTAMDESTKRFQKTMDASRAGIADFPDLFLDDFRKIATLGFGEASDSLVATMDLIQGSLQSNLVSPMVLVNGNINEVARQFSSLREEMEDTGLDLYRNLDFRGQNEVFQSLLDAQLRGDRMTDIRDIDVRSNMSEQISALRLISENTGLSLDELVKSNGTALRSLASAQATGLITAEQQKNLTALMVDMGANAPEFESLLTKIIESGGSRAAFEAANPDIAAAFRKIGVSDYYETMNALKDMGPVQAREQGLIFGQQVSDATKAFVEVRGGQGVAQLGVAYQTLAAITTGTNTMKELDENRGKQSNIVRWLNKFKDMMENKWPIIGLVSAITAQGVFTLLQVRALHANTMALRARSGGLGGGPDIGGGPDGGGGGGSRGRLGRIGAFAGKALKAGGVITALGMAGKDMYDAAQGDASNENTGALIGTAIGGLLGTLIPIPGVGTMMGMAIGAGVGNFAGETIGSLLPATSKGAAPMKAGISAPQLTQMAGAGSSVSQTAMVTNMVTQTRILESIAGSMHTNNALQREIRDRIGFGTGGGDGAPRDSTKKPNNIALIPGRLGS